MDECPAMRQRAWVTFSVAKRKNDRWKLVENETTDLCKGLTMEGLVRPL